MKKNKIIATCLSAALTLTGCSSNNEALSYESNTTSLSQELIITPNEILEYDTTTSISGKQEETSISSNDTTTQEQTLYSSKTTITEVIPDITTTKSITTEETLNEDELIKILEDQEQLIMDEAVNGDKDSLKEKLDEYFTLTIGFLFCDQPIKGKTLNDLTTSAKVKIVSITSNINDVIEEYYPDYKITIKETFTDAKEWTLDKFKTGTSFIKNKVKDKIGEDNYNKISDTYDKTKMKIKDIGSSALDKADELIDKGVTKIKDWWHNKTNK